MLTLNDGRAELWQWDTGRTLAVDADCSQVHFSNKVFGRSIDVDVTDGIAIIPDILLQNDKDLNVWAFVGTAESGYTKISKTFKVNRRNKPADYVFTPPEQTSLEEIKEKIDYLESIQDPDAIKNAVNDYLEQNPVESPVKSVNGQTGEVQLTAEDVGAIADETDPTVPAWAKQPQKPIYTADEVGALPDTYTPPNQTAQQVGADPAGTAASAVSQHNTDTTAHNDIRLALQWLHDRINAALDSDDTTLDQMSEVVAYIKSNKNLIDAITTSKINIADIVNDLVTNVTDKPLSAAQGVVLKGLIDELRALIPEAYTLPTATETTLGGVKAAAATEDMTQPVGITADGQLVTAPSPDSGGNVDQSGGLTSAQISALDGMFKIASFTADPTAAYAAFKTAFGITDSGEEEPEVTLTSISATYSGGDVTAGTAVDDLTGIVVTAHYSDGTSETVTGYTLSGTIAEGSNTITVSYGGMTTTFTVTGTSAGTTDDYAVHNYSDYSWTNGGILRNNTFQEFSNYSYSEYIPCEVGVCYETNAVFYQPIAGMYDENDNHLGDISSRGIMFISNNNAKKLRLNALTSDIPSAYFARYVHDPASSEYVFPEYKWTLGSYVNASGQIVSLSSYSYSEYIPVESGREILLCTNAVNFSIAFYDANKEFTRTVNAGSESTEVSINVASDEQYFVLNSSTNACGSKAFYWKYAE